MYVHYRNGYLPLSGGIMDQTEYYCRCMEVLDTQVALVQQDVMDKERAKMGKGSKGRPPAKAPRRRAPRRRHK